MNYLPAGYSDNCRFIDVYYHGDPFFFFHLRRSIGGFIPLVFSFYGV